MGQGASVWEGRFNVCVCVCVCSGVYKLTVELYPTSNLFAKGHRIRIDVSSSCFPHFDLNQNTGVNLSKHSLVALNTVHHSPAYPSALRLPIVPTGTFKARRRKSKQRTKQRASRRTGT